MKTEQQVTIAAPNFKTAVYKIVGTTPLVMNKFSQKSREEMRNKQAEGGQSAKKKTRTAKDFKACYEGAFHKNSEGWIGMPAAAFRAAMISACRLVDFKMTIAKMSLFIEADGIDVDEGTPLVKIEGKPRPLEMAVRNETGVVDIRVRPIFEKWGAELRVRFDADRFNETDIANLLMRAGLQVGIGEGRPDSKRSCGQGWGTFALAGARE